MTDPDDTLLDYLADKRLLLVLDNYEHLLSGPDEDRRDGYGLVTKLVVAAPDVKLLITSRSRLNVTAEWLAPLEGMHAPPEHPAHDGAGANGSPVETIGRTWSEAIPGETPESPSERVQALANYSAAALFLACARRLRPDFEPTGDEARTIGRICRLLGGMPLGIELAAAWTRTLSLAEIASRLERGMDLLRSTARDVPSAPPQHHRCIRLFVAHALVPGAKHPASTGRILRRLHRRSRAQRLRERPWPTWPVWQTNPGCGSSLRVESRRHPAAARCTSLSTNTAPKSWRSSMSGRRETPDQVRDRHTTYYLTRLKARREIVTTWQDRFLPLLADLDNYNEVWRRAIEGDRFETLRDLFAVVSYPDASARTQLQTAGTSPPCVAGTAEGARDDFANV